MIFLGASQVTLPTVKWRWKFLFGPVGRLGKEDCGVDLPIDSGVARSNREKLKIREK